MKSVYFGRALNYCIIFILLISFLLLSYDSLEKYLEKNTIVQTKSKAEDLGILFKYHCLISTILQNKKEENIQT